MTHTCCDHCECAVPRHLKDISHDERKKLPRLFCTKTPIVLCVVPKHTLYSSPLFYDPESKTLVPDMQVRIENGGTLLSTTAYWCFMKEALPAQWLLDYDVVSGTFLDALRDIEATKSGIAEMLIMKLRSKMASMVPRMMCIEMDRNEYHVTAQRIWYMSMGNSIVQLFEFKATVSCCLDGAISEFYSPIQD